MNRVGLCFLQITFSVPRASGDEPQSSHDSSNHPMCSPRERG